MPIQARGSNRWACCKLKNERCLTLLFLHSFYNNAMPVIPPPAPTITIPQPANTFTRCKPGAQKEQREEFPHLCSVHGAGMRVTHLHCTLRGRVLCLHVFLLGLLGCSPVSFLFWSIYRTTFPTCPDTISLVPQQSSLWFLHLSFWSSPSPVNPVILFYIAPWYCWKLYIFLQSGISFSFEKKKCLSLGSHFKRPGPIFPLFIEPGPASFYLGLNYEKACTVHTSRLNCVPTSYPCPDVYVEAFTPPPPQCYSTWR